MKTVYPKRNHEQLHNPGKGYILYKAFNGKAPETFPEYASKFYRCLETTSCLNIKLSWKVLQPECEDKYDWSYVDEVLSLAERLGKRVMFGFCVLVSTGGPQEGVRSWVPQWVYDAGAKYNDVDCANYTTGVRNVNRIPEW